MERRLPGLGQRRIGVRALLDQILAELPMAVEGGGVEIEIGAQIAEGNAFGDQEADCADIAIISAPADQGRGMRIDRGRVATARDPIEDEVRAAVGDSLDHRDPS